MIEGKLRQSEAFVEERRGGMQAYLNELLSHPVLGTSEPLYVFLNEPTSDLRSSRGWQALQPRGATLLDGAARLAKQAVGAAPTAPSPQELSLPPRVTGNMRRLWRERVVEAAGGLQRAEVSGTIGLPMQLGCVQQWDHYWLPRSRGRLHTCARLGDAVTCALRDVVTVCCQLPPCLPACLLCCPACLPTNSLLAGSLTTNGANLQVGPALRCFFASQCCCWKRSGW